MNPKVSVVVPVYKNEKYIDECVESMLSQDYDNLEIILVDDGSPDGCPEICDRYAQNDPRIKVIHKPNSGSGLSRNAGVDASTGEYIVFVDSDDKLDGPNAVSVMMNTALSNDADLVVGCYRRFDEDGETEVNNHHLKQGENVFDPDFRFRSFYQYGHLAYDWAKLYKKSFLVENRLKHGNYPFTQDKAFNMDVYAYGPKYVFIDESVYCYRVNKGSVTYKYKENFIPVWTSIASDFSRFLKERKIDIEMGDLPALHIYYGSFFLVKQELTAGRGIFGAAARLKEYARIPYVRKSMKRIIALDYTKGIKTKSWRFMIWASSLLFTLHMYIPFTLGISLLRQMNLDDEITKRRYKK